LGTTVEEVLMSDGLTLEKLEISERLTKLETQQKLFIETTGENISKLNHIIIGNGEKGLSEKVRNLEESEVKRQNYSKAAWLAIIGLACKSVWDTIIGK
jgi:hypothetical protein